jgi:uncharacterized DUF497 family protein
MVITFDPKKDKLNLLKHGISLSAASAFDWGTATIWTDQRYHYHELRECGLGLIGKNLYFIVFVDHGSSLRVISLRKANKGEARRYAIYRP